MSLESILGNIIAAVIYGAIAFLAKKYYLFFKELPGYSAEKTHTPKKQIKNQFYTFLASLAASTVIFCSIPSRPFLLFIKVLTGLIMGFSFIFVWGVFDAMLPFYPEDDIVPEPPDQDTHDDSPSHE